MTNPRSEMLTDPVQRARLRLDISRARNRLEQARADGDALSIDLEEAQLNFLLDKYNDHQEDTSEAHPS